MAKIKQPDARIAENKKAFFDYYFEDRFEAGIVLEGWEVKSLRAGKVQLTDGYIVVRNDEVFIVGLQIQPLKTTSTHSDVDKTRTRKLLLKRDEIKCLIGKTAQRGYTIVPINMHWKDNKIKCDIALAKGKGEHDKRSVIKDREGKREVERAMKTR